jgi:CheY-like chemotaxis protein
LTQEKLDSVTSENCRLSLVLFDEIEKAALSLTQLLLGILDKGILQLADGNLVNFENSLIFFTSNLGAREMAHETGPGLGFQPSTPKARTELTQKLESIAVGAVRKRFSPEFVNRIDAVITYLPLEAGSLAQILDQHIRELQNHVNTRLGSRNFSIEVLPQSREFLLQHGTSPEYGARELKRTVHRYLTQPLAAKVAAGQIDPGAQVRIEASSDSQSLSIRTIVVSEATTVSRPDVLIVDDNADLLAFLEQYLSASAWRIRTASSVKAAQTLFQDRIPDAVVLDFLLPDGNGVRIGREWLLAVPSLRVMVMSGAALPVEEAEICEQFDFPILQKPFVAAEILNLIRNRLTRTAGAGANLGN